MPQRAKRIVFRYFGQVEQRGSKMTVIMHGGQAVMVTIDTTDAPQGNHQPVDGPPQWTSSDQAKLVVSPYPDGYGAHISVPLGVTGAFSVTVTADGDTGPGTRIITGVLDFDVQAVNLATEIRFAPGEPY